MVLLKLYGRHVLVIALITLQYLIGEAWHLAPESGQWAPHLIGDHWDTPQWIVKDISTHLQVIIIAVVLYIIGRWDPGLRIILTAYLTYTVLDLVAWFIDFKQWPYYAWVYLIVALTEIAGLTYKFYKK